MELVAEKMNVGAGTRYSVLRTRYSVLGKSSRRVLLAMLLLAAAGCSTTADFISCFSDGPPPGDATLVSAVWHDQVLFCPDPVNGGVMSPGLNGRLFFFGPNMGFPLAANGDVTIGLFDPAEKGPDGSPKFLGTWRIEKAMLPQFLRHDTVGWGYSLLLPWPSYRPEIKQVEIRVRYDPAKKGLPIYTQPATICFNHILDVQSSSTSQLIRTPEQKGGVAPASHQTPAKGS